jgi:hypothetical protein
MPCSLGWAPLILPKDENAILYGRPPIGLVGFSWRNETAYKLSRLYMKNINIIRFGSIISVGDCKLA